MTKILPPLGVYARVAEIAEIHDFLVGLENGPGLSVLPTFQPLYRPKRKRTGLGHLPRVEPGKRCLVLGRSGSGKTAGAAWLLQQSLPVTKKWVILNPKDDELLARMGPHVDWEPQAILDALKTNNIVVVHPDASILSDPMKLDKPLFDLVETEKPISFLIDELLYFQKGNSTAGPGIMGLLTRGRSRGQAMIATTQRPANISQYFYSEANYYAIYSLTQPADQDRVTDFTNQPDLARERKPYYWVWYDVDKNISQEFGPVPYKKLLQQFPLQEK